MITQLGDINAFGGNFIDDSVFVIYSAGPVSGKGMFEGLWFTNALKRGAFDLFD
jgi:hypothetical protein